MSKTLIGYGRTNSQGIATLDHNSDDETITGYTGTGAGVLNITAECGDLVSSVFTVGDYLWYDPMTSDVSKWSASNASLTAEFSDDGTTLTNSTGNTYNYTSTYSAADNAIIEFDIQATSTDIGQVRFYYKGADRYMKTALTDGNSHHMKFVCNNGSVTWYVDGVETGNAQTSTSSTVMRISVNGATVIVKDFKVYTG